MSREHTHTVLNSYRVLTCLAFPLFPSLFSIINFEFAIFFFKLFLNEFYNLLCITYFITAWKDSQNLQSLKHKTYSPVPTRQISSLLQIFLRSFPLTIIYLRTYKAWERTFLGKVRNTWREKTTLPPPELKARVSRHRNDSSNTFNVPGSCYVTFMQLN